MSQSRTTPIGFSLDDLLMKIIPGSVVTIPFLFQGYIMSPDLVSQNTRIITLLLVVFSVIFGEIVNLIRSLSRRVPDDFRYFLYVKTGREDTLGRGVRFERWAKRRIPFMNIKEGSEEYYLFEELGWDFSEQFQQDFDLSLEDTRPRHVYDALVFSLEPKFSPRTKRHFTTYIFAENLIIALIGIGAYSLIATLMYLLEFMQSPPYVSLAGAGLILVGFAIVPYFIHSETLYVESLFKEYYYANQDVDG